MRYKSPFADVLKGKKEKPARVKHPRYRFELSIDTITDKDIITELEKYPNKSEYVRDLIRADIKKRAR